jgi:hypothetical protein
MRKGKGQRNGEEIDKKENPKRRNINALMQACNCHICRQTWC